MNDNVPNREDTLSDLMLREARDYLSKPKLSPEDHSAVSALILGIQNRISEFPYISDSSPATIEVLETTRQQLETLLQ